VTGWQLWSACPLLSTFKYGPNHARFYQNTDGKETYYVAGGLYEEIIESGVTTQRSYVGGVLVHEKTGATEQVRYLHRDHLGSVEAITDELGDRVERLAFAPFGERRMADWSDGSPVSMTMTRGFTGHEHVDTFNLIHMNGRVFDPSIGRFLSADPIVQAPANTQSYNRYSYVFNNPLSFTDPSGYAADDDDIPTVYGSCTQWAPCVSWHGPDGRDTPPTEPPVEDGTGAGGGSGSGGGSDNSDWLGGFYGSGHGSGSGRTGGQIVSEFRAMFAIVDRFAIPIKKIHGAIASNAVVLSNRRNDNIAVQRSGFDDQVLNWLAENFSITISGTSDLTAMPIGGTAKIIANPFSGKYPEAYIGGGAVKGRTIRGTIDFKLYEYGGVSKDKPVVKVTSCAGNGLGGCLTLNMGGGGFNVVISSGAVYGNSNSAVVGKYYKFDNLIQSAINRVMEE
jgi:RHS repeat-associated protein